MKTTKICRTCSKEFTPFNSLVKYCCFGCVPRQEKVTKVYVKNVSLKQEKLVYPKNNNKPIPEFEKNKKIIKAQMIEEKGYVYCQHCGATHSPFWETHHIIFRSEKPGHPKLHSLENLIHLCYDCHENKFHKKKGVRIYLVYRRGLDKIFGSDVLKAA
jgi:5-methylcytosine-specific restriction endonuclease McrA